MGAKVPLKGSIGSWSCRWMMPCSRLVPSQVVKSRSERRSFHCPRSKLLRSETSLLWHLHGRVRHVLEGAWPPPSSRERRVAGPRQGQWEMVDLTTETRLLTSLLTLPLLPS